MTLRSTDTQGVVEFAGGGSLAKSASAATMRQQFADSLTVAKEDEEIQLWFPPIRPRAVPWIRYGGKVTRLQDCKVWPMSLFRFARTASIVRVVRRPAESAYP